VHAEVLVNNWGNETVGHLLKRSINNKQLLTKVNEKLIGRGISPLYMIYLAIEFNTMKSKNVFR